MFNAGKDNKKSPRPSNVSAHYYTDPIYSTDAYYGYVDDDESIEAKDADNLHDAIDEPVESWGWINNAD